jgi:hypothetical protein
VVDDVQVNKYAKNSVQVAVQGNQKQILGVQISDETQHKRKRADEDEINN